MVSVHMLPQSTALHLLAAIDQPLLGRRNTFLFFYTFLDASNSIIGFDIDFDLQYNGSNVSVGQWHAITYFFSSESLVCYKTRQVLDVLDHDHLSYKGYLDFDKHDG
jgi:hypothetical protein